jgi:aldehyde dehydrogenase (NAD(P)+)
MEVNMNRQTVTDSGVGESALLDQYVSRLQAAKDKWATLSIFEKLELLQTIIRNLEGQMKEWVARANEARQIVPNSLWAAEEWYEIYSIGRTLYGYKETLMYLAHGAHLHPKRTWSRPDGQVVTQVFPANTFDWLLFNGMTSEVWMTPDIVLEDLPQHMGAFYRKLHPLGRVALVLGAGNVNSIPALDMLDRLFVHGQVVLLKLSPVNGYLRTVFEAIFAPLIKAGYLAIVEGDATVGSYLVNHPDIEEIHVTGGQATYDAILYGLGAAGRVRQQEGDVLLHKPVSAELGGVTPVIVPPGDWTDADIQFQAENIVTMKLYNSGFNCISAQLLIISESWAQKQQLLDAVQQMMAALPAQHAYYPGAAQRQHEAQLSCPDAVLLGGDVPRTFIPSVTTQEAYDACLQNEFFGPVLAVESLPGKTDVSFLENAVTFCNESVYGTLGVDLIVSPEVEKDAVETAVANLRYGAIGVNAWCGLIYRISQNPWGAFQDADAVDIGSGNCMVHNTLLFDSPQKAVVRGGFRPFPRSWQHGDFTLSPKPPWFVTHNQRNSTAQRVARFSLNPGYVHLPGIFAAALRG